MQTDQPILFSVRTRDRSLARTIAYSIFIFQRILHLFPWPTWPKADLMKQTFEVRDLRDTLAKGDSEKKINSGTTTVLKTKWALSTSFSYLRYDGKKTQQKK